MIAILSELVERRGLADDRHIGKWLGDLRPFRANLGVAFLESADQHRSVPSLVTAAKSISYHSIANAAINVANFVAAKFSAQSSRPVLLPIENSPEYLAGFYGILLAGHVAVPLPATIELPRLERIQANCGAELLLSTETIAAKRDRYQQPSVHHIDLSATPVAPRLGDLPQGTDLAIVLHTSGSSDQPKGVMLSHANLLSNAHSILAYLPIRQADRTLALLPFCYAYGNSVLQAHMLRGATMVVDGSPTFPASIVDALQAHQINSFAAVPELCHSLLTLSDLGRQPLPALRYVTVAGGALRPDDAFRLSERIAPAELYLMYGQTEATARLAYLPPAELSGRADSIGKAIPGVELQVRDAAGQPTGEIGELCARGPNVMLGYWNDSAATSRALKDGWLRTGDLAMQDEQGFIYLKGRRSSEIKLQGKRVDLDAITIALQRRLPTCHLAFVPFQANQTTRLALFLECADATAIEDEVVRQACRDTLARHEMPHHIEVLQILPQTGSLKLDYPALRKRAEEHFESNECISMRSHNPNAAA